jgi:hypothetical protein
MFEPGKRMALDILDCVDSGMCDIFLRRPSSTNCFDRAEYVLYWF